MKFLSNGFATAQFLIVAQFQKRMLMRTGISGAPGSVIWMENEGRAVNRLFTGPMSLLLLL
ncbi:hypothetical protein RP29_19985 [Acidovorax temperans]|uniref:Uncharacterized protein n=1 Tax=Acidovorax temperans TaxID=80878 RepID=A0A0D7K3D5_9BURK|nr:hypothetical protein [Acidovorax temperans]KJA08805.1 hypothetical protein RP29_19985 [Acidovorax temperans]